MIKTQPFGRTGHLSTRTLFGAAAFGKVSQTEADITMDLLMSHGVNHIDTAASYGDSELRLGPWMKRYRNYFFLATKTGERRKGAAWDEFRRSLDRLQTDQVDLIQLHNLNNPDDWQVAMGSGGALEACLEAKAQGLVRFIGVTGHEVRVAGMHERSLAAFDFDSVLLPYNYLMMQNPVYAMGFEQVVAACQRSNAAVQTIKSITRRRYTGDTRSHATWYEPLTAQADIDLAVAWALSRPGIFLNTAGDIALLPKVLSAAERFTNGALPVPSTAQMQALVEAQQMTPMFF